MSYPDVAAADIRGELPKITATLYGDTPVGVCITAAQEYVESMLAGQCDLVSIKALTTTPVILKQAIRNRTCFEVLKRFYSDSRSGGPSAEDVGAYAQECDRLIAGILDGTLRIVNPATATEYSAGIGYATLDTNKRGFSDQDHIGGDPYFDNGSFGHRVSDPNNRQGY